METNFECPVCCSNELEPIKQHQYESNYFYNPIGLNNQAFKFVALRRHILCYLWFKDQQDIQLTSVLCNDCGFVCYSPRPTENDLFEKYTFLNRIKKKKEINSFTKRSNQIIDKRAHRLYHLMIKYKQDNNFSILDYGGGSGELLTYFVNERVKCYLIDFNTQINPGIQKIGSTIADLPSESSFNVIVCSHVLEHVVNPVSMLKQLRGFLKSNGVIYIEIPVEIWEGVPVQHDPVTHINYFTKESLRKAIVISGFKVDKIKYDIQPYGNKYKRVAWAIISKDDALKTTFHHSSKLTMQLLKPNRLKKLWRVIEDRWLNYLNKPDTALIN